MPDTLQTHSYTYPTCSIILFSSFNSANITAYCGISVPGMLCSHLEYNSDILYIFSGEQETRRFI